SSGTMPHSVRLGCRMRHSGTPQRLRRRERARFPLPAPCLTSFGLVAGTNSLANLAGSSDGGASERVWADDALRGQGFARIRRADLWLMMIGNVKSKVCGFSKPVSILGRLVRRVGEAAKGAAIDANQFRSERCVSWSWPS